MKYKYIIFGAWNLQKSGIEIFSAVQCNASEQYIKSISQVYLLGNSHLLVNEMWA